VRGRRSLGSIVWFLWMVGMWLAFFVRLFADRLDELWSSIRDLSLLVQILLWVAFLPKMLDGGVDDFVGHVDSRAAGCVLRSRLDDLVSPAPNDKRAPGRLALRGRWRSKRLALSDRDSCPGNVDVGHVVTLAIRWCGDRTRPWSQGLPGNRTRASQRSVSALWEHLTRGRAAQAPVRP
jgi:hypothetical protein